jgi:SAM-dependent methyltransferase
MSRDAITCPVCREGRTEVFLDRAEVPVHQNLLHATREAARGVRRGRLRMCCCEECGFVFNAAFDESLLSYGREYDNTQTASPAFDAYTDELADRVAQAPGRSAPNVPGTVVEVGCGKGGFLIKVLQRAPAWRGVGYDPTYEGDLSLLDGRARFRREFFGPESPERDADVVICRHVIEHVATPASLLGAVRAALSPTRPVRLFFETPDVTWILKHMVVWDFFYEHCSLYAPGSIRRAFSASGLSVERVGPVFGDQYMWIEGRGGPGERGAHEEHLPPVTEHAVPMTELARAYGVRVGALLERWRDRLDHWRSAGPVVIWGAGAKGATLANLIDPEAGAIECLIDVSPAKQGRHVPGTGHQIVPPESLGRMTGATVLVLNPNYVSEIRESVASLGARAQVVDLMNDWSTP